MRIIQFNSSSITPGTKTRICDVSAGQELWTDDTPRRKFDCLAVLLFMREIKPKQIKRTDPPSSYHMFLYFFASIYSHSKYYYFYATYWLLSFLEELLHRDGVLAVGSKAVIAY